MSVVECKIEAKRDAVDAIEETIGALEEPRWIVLEDRLAGRAWIVGYFPIRIEAKEACRRLEKAIDPGWVTGEMDWRELTDADWAESYKAHFKPWRIGRHHWVPEWERGIFRVKPGDRIVWLDPGMAFGTGNHETTRLCCERLVEYADAWDRQGVGRQGRHCRSVHGLARHPDPGVIDAGCGSGILAISAARFGLGPVVGFDNDPIAVRVSRENAVLNEVASQVEFFDGDLSTGLAGRRAGLVLANIHTDVLRRGAKDLLRAVAPGGWLSLSGILARELEALRADFLGATERDSEDCPVPTQPTRRNCRQPGPKSRANQSITKSGWRSFSRRLGEWADLLLIRAG